MSQWNSESKRKTINCWKGGMWLLKRMTNPPVLSRTTPTRYWDQLCFFFIKCFSSFRISVVCFLCWSWFVKKKTCFNAYIYQRTYTCFNTCYHSEKIKFEEFINKRKTRNDTLCPYEFWKKRRGVVCVKLFIHVTLCQSFSPKCDNRFWTFHWFF